MATREVDKPRWKDFFDNLSRELLGKSAELEIASLRLGDQIEGKWIPFLGIAYDPKDDAVEILLEGIDHLVRRPQQVFVEDSAGGLVSIEVIDATGTRRILKLRDPLMLLGPSPQRRAAG